MKKNRILSMILSVIMMFTIVFSTGVFAEETEVSEVEPVVEEIVVETEAEDAAVQDSEPVESADEEEQPADEQETTDAEEEPEVSEEAADPMPANEAVEEQAEAEEELPFEQGYVRVDDGASVYASESRKNAIGSFGDAAVVYAVVTLRADEEANSWLRITFDTAEAKEADKALLNGYVQFKDVTVLSDEEIEQLVKSLKSDVTIRSYKDNLLPVVDFEAIEDVVAEDEGAEEEADAEVTYAAEATTLQITEQPVDVAAAAGEAVTFHVAAKGDGLSYQWQRSDDKGATWTDCFSSGATTANMTFVMAAAYNNRQFRCIVSDGNGNSVKSDVITLHISNQIVDGDFVFDLTADGSGYYLKVYTGSASNVTVPGTVNGMTVTEIGEEAFMDNKSLVSIDLPDTITVIRARAFKNCSKLSEMK